MGTQANPTPEQLHAAGLARLPDGAECWLAELGDCSGKLEAHHVIPKRILKGPLGRKIARSWRVTTAILVADWRNGIRLCHHHHGQVDRSWIIIDPLDLPVRVWAFCRQFDLEDVLHSTHRRRLRHASQRNVSRVYSPRTASGHG